MSIAPLLLPLLMMQTADTFEKKDTTVGTGTEVQVGDYVRVEYTGTLKDGTQFDSNKGKSPFPVVVGFGQVIKGWDEGLLGMKEGGIRQLIIPSGLAYGDQGMGPIPPKATLKFEVKLLKLEPRAQITVVTKGTGPKAKVGDQLTVQVKVSLKDGKVLDDTHKLDKAPSLRLGGRMPLPGFGQALLGLQQGEKRTVLIPPGLAFGAAGIPDKDMGDTKAGSVIPPNATLTLEIELVKLTPAPEAPK